MNPTWLAASSRQSEIMSTCRALLEGRLEGTVALSVTTLAVPTTLWQISTLLETQWSEKIAAVAGRLVNAVAFAQAGSERSKKAAAALTGAVMHHMHSTACDGIDDKEPSFSCLLRQP